MSVSSAQAVWHVVRHSAGTVVCVGRSDVWEPSQLSESQLSAQVSAAAEVGSVVQNLVRDSPDRLVAVLINANASALLRLVPHLPQLAKTPVVFHVATAAQHADVLGLRQSGCALVYSSTAAGAQDEALVAHQLASTARRGVIHFYDAASGPMDPVHLPPAAFSVAAVANAHLDVDAAYAAVSTLAGHPVQPYTLYGRTADARAFAVVLGAGAQALAAAASLPVLAVHLVRPFLADRIAQEIPASVERVVVLEQCAERTTRLAPLFLDVAGALQQDPQRASTKVLSGTLGVVTSANVADAAKHLHAELDAEPPAMGFRIGDDAAAPPGDAFVLTHKERAHERAYTAMLHQLFRERLSLENALEEDSGAGATSPEFAFGKVLSQLQEHDRLERVVRDALRTNSVPDALGDALRAWLAEKEDVVRGVSAAERIRDALSSAPHAPLVDEMRALVQHFEPRSRWIIGSDAWAYDAGMGGVHHVIASRRNINMLIFDTMPYSGREHVPLHQRKKDIGLYAMNYGGVYVASTAVYSDYTQVLHALMEADRFEGPAVVLAYVPYATTDVPALDVLRETKLGVDSGYWPLYRWNPAAPTQEKAFRLDSVRIRQQLQDFLDRDNHFSMVANARPQLPYDVSVSQGEALRAHQQRRAQDAYASLLGALEGLPVLVLFASDGGAAEKVARRLGTRASMRGLGARVLAMDDFPIAELASEPNVVFVSSTAGQGEAPQNGRATFKTLGKLPANTFSGDTSFAVFGMGDSHYWPRPEDAHYYNKPGKDLDRRLAELGAQRMADLGLGDDQDADGWQTGYRAWESTLWKALGVDTVEVTEAEPEPITNEHIKIASNYLRGTIAEGLADKSTGAICETDTQLTKFHGTYLQWDRDTLEERKNAGLEPAYGFMVRVRMPGGVCTPEQWLQLDKVAGEYGGIKSLKITTRQTVQYHMILKENMKAAMQGINQSLLDTIAACGDVNRNVMCSSNPHMSELHEATYEFAQGLSDFLLPRMNAYHEIWLDKDTDSKRKLLVGGAVQDYEPLYGPYYLPRKFKIAIAVPPRNDVDVFAHDIGLIAIADPDTKTLRGFNLSVGGGMGVTHSMKATYPRLGSVIGFVTPEQTPAVCREVMLIQRDTGNRQNRKQARLKYTIDKYWGGADNFCRELERRLGYELAPARPFSFEANTDEYGWRKDFRGKWHCTLWLENGRVIDEPGNPFRTGLTELAKIHRGTFRLTPNQHIIVCGVDDAEKPRVHALLQEYNMVKWEASGLRLSASACVALPTCALAMAESERYLFHLIDKVERIYFAAGLRHDEIVTRMTGCPNGCARPWVAEIAFVGKAPGTYVMLLGGGHAGERLNKIYRENVQEEEILQILGVLIPRYAKDRLDGEKFGDWVIRAGVIAETTHGAAFYDNVDTERPLITAA
ncbi:assimilatory sulfite reductase (NADPH) [Malassezia sp. CBS 17886]|nr:assimilatory sulfite reductase (NADPH) [Malassezia sp. CBS 17886]